VNATLEPNCLRTPPELAAKIGVSEAIVLQQIHYWMSIGSGRIIDGVRWIYNSLDQWLAQFPWLSKWQLRKVFNRLRNELQLVQFAKHEKSECKHRGWYTIDYQKLGELRTSMCEQYTHTDVCNGHTSNNKETEEQTITTTATLAAVSEKIMEPDWEKVEQQTLIWEQEQLTGEPPSFEQPPVTHYVDEPNQDCETNDVDLHEDTFSAAADETVEKPSREELQEIYQQLRQLPCTPAFKLNSQIQNIVAKYWRNVPGAVAYLKEAIRTWKKVESVEAVFVKACKEGRKPDNWGKPKVNHPQPKEEQLTQLIAAKSRREIFDCYQQPDGLWVVDTGKAVIAWWELVPGTVDR
jgi:hypothetical protein